MNYVTAFGLSLLAAMLLTPAVIRGALRLGLCDLPNGSGLKIHSQPVPDSGGLAILIPVTGSILLVPALRSGLPGGSLWLAVGCTLITATGLIDDRRDLPPSVRLSIQCLAAILLIVSGFNIATFPSIIANAVVSGAIVLGSINALNLLDGMDGLASGVSAICCGALALMLAVSGDTAGVVLALVLLGALLGFLPYNFHPARVFLGNGGSALVGYLLAALVLMVASRPDLLSGLVAPVLVLGLQGSDTVLAITRRLQRGRGIFSGDRDHFYDRLLRHGFSQKQTAMIAYCISFCFGAIALAMTLL